MKVECLLSYVFVIFLESVWEIVLRREHSQKNVDEIVREKDEYACVCVYKKDFVNSYLASAVQGEEEL